jgi:hypothetical protein
MNSELVVQCSIAGVKEWFHQKGRQTPKIIIVLQGFFGRRLLFVNRGYLSYGEFL